MQNNNPYVNITDNTNASEGKDFLAFFKVIIMFIVTIVCIFCIMDFIGSAILLNLPIETQHKIEQKLSPIVEKHFTDKLLDESDKKDLNRVKILAYEVIKTDENLLNDGNFSYHIIKADEVNAFVTASGTIYFTDKLMKEIKYDEQLSFIIAHEMGHYIHKDHLRNISRLVSGIVLYVVGAIITGDRHTSDIILETLNITDVRHTQAQEINADKFADMITKKIYKSDDKVIEFFEMIDAKNKSPEALYFFSTHPSPKNRIELLKSY